MGHLPRLRYGKYLSWNALAFGASARTYLLKAASVFTGIITLLIYSFLTSTWHTRHGMRYWSRPWYADNKYLNTQLILFPWSSE